jgi:GT2 family glycosyltransferase
MSLTASIVIPTLNRESVLCETLESILEVAENSGLVEIIVVDQSKTHLSETVQRLEILAKNSLLQYHQVDFRGTTKARNYGTSLAKGDIVIFLDDDVFLCSAFVQAHLKVYHNPEIAGVAGCVIHKGEIKLAECDLDPSSMARVKSGKQALFNLSFAYQAKWARGCNMSFRREWIYKAGGFDENFYGVAVGEEPEFCHRLLMAGGHILYAPEAEVFHRADLEGGSRDVTDPKDRFIAFVDNAIYYGLCIKSNRFTRTLELLRIASYCLINSKVLFSGRLLHYLSWYWKGLEKGKQRFRDRNDVNGRAGHLR